MLRDRSGRGRLRRPIVAAVGLALLAQSGGVQAGLQERLEAARKKVKAIERELVGARAREEAIRREIQSLTRQIAQAYAQKQVISGHIKETRSSVEESTREIASLQERLNERARAAYIQGPAGVVEVVLEADSLTDLSDRVAFIDMLTQADASLATGIDTERGQLERFEGSLRKLRREQNRLLESLNEKNEQLQDRFAAQAAVKEEIEAKLAEAKRVVKDLEKKYQRQLLAAIAAQSFGGRPAPNVDGRPGPFFACPVDRPRSYIDDFGYPRPGGRSHQGNDILAPQGTPIRAPFDGTARESSNSLGGLSVHVYAPNGDYVYNAHLSRYAGVSGRVRAGQIIGYVGDTGNARGGPYHNHFEYHPGGGSAVSPYHYLNEVCGIGGG